MGVSVQYLTQLGLGADFYIFSLEPYVWPDEISQWNQQQVCIRFCAILRKSAMEIMTVFRQSFREEIMSHTQVFEWKSPSSLRLEKARQVKSKVKSVLIVFFYSRGMFTKNLSWHTNQ
jgi:hypothetical protein